MNSLLDEFRYRRSLIKDMSYREASLRLKGFFEWVEKNEQLREIIDKFEPNPDVDRVLEHKIKPSTINPEFVTAFGINIMKLAHQGEQLSNIAKQYGIMPASTRPNYQTMVNEVMRRYVDPALDHIERILEKESLESDISNLLTNKHKSVSDYPLEITDSLRKFMKDHKEFRKNAFVMMRFGETRAHEEIFQAISETLAKYDIKALRADGKEYHEDLFPNVLTYIYGSVFGIAVFERLEEEYFNPNVSLEVGYMRALKKPICLLKDRTLRTLQTDLVGKLYREFDPQSPKESIPTELEKWLRDKELITL